MSTSGAGSAIADDLRTLFGPRLRSVVEYDGGHTRTGTHTLAIIDGLTAADLHAAAAKVPAWHRAQFATPLLFGAHEFEEALDAFPLEFSAILARHRVLAGPDPFTTRSVDPADLRRACELQARSHLLHLRQGYLETGGRPDAVATLITRSAPSFRGLLDSLERLEGARPHVATGIAADIAALAGVTTLSEAEAERLFPAYVDAVERLVKYIDGWTAAT
jgi:hypothetical protein